MAVYGRRAANAVQRRFCCLQSFWRTVPAVVQRTLCTDDVVLCCRSVVLSYSSGCRAANVVYRRCCALPSFRLLLRLLRPSFVVSLVACWHRHAASTLAAHLGHVFSHFSSHVHTTSELEGNIDMFTSTSTSTRFLRLTPGCPCLAIRPFCVHSTSP